MWNDFIKLSFVKILFTTFLLKIILVEKESCTEQSVLPQWRAHTYPSDQVSCHSQCEIQKDSGSKWPASPQSRLEGTVYGNILRGHLKSVGHIPDHCVWKVEGIGKSQPATKTEEPATLSSPLQRLVKGPVSG